MVVVTLTNCPPKLRGDITKWLLEINTGVYVGNVSARVRDALWQRICENIGKGQATMVFNAKNEQHMDFYVHNTEWEPVDFDGIKLIKRLNKYPTKESVTEGYSIESKMLMAKRKKEKSSSMLKKYVIIDLETSGLSVKNDKILEIGAIVVNNGECISEHQWLIKSDIEIPENITILTGIKKEDIIERGEELSEVLDELYEITDEQSIIAYNADFDIEFLEEAYNSCEKEMPDLYVNDIMKIAVKKLKKSGSYKLENIAAELGIGIKQEHRALADCMLLYNVCLKLNEI